MENLNKYKDDPVLFAEEILGVDLFEYQKAILIKVHEARKNGQEITIHYPYRNGRTIMNRVWDSFLKTQ